MKVEDNTTGNLRSAIKSQLDVRRLVTLHVQVGIIGTPVQFLVIEDLGTDILLGTDYIYLHVRKIIPKSREVVPRIILQSSLCQSDIGILQ